MALVVFDSVEIHDIEEDIPSSGTRGLESSMKLLFWIA